MRPINYILYTKGAVTKTVSINHSLSKDRGQPRWNQTDFLLLTSQMFDHQATPAHSKYNAQHTDLDQLRATALRTTEKEQWPKGSNSSLITLLKNPGNCYGCFPYKQPRASRFEILCKSQCKQPGTVVVMPENFTTDTHKPIAIQAETATEARPRQRWCHRDRDDVTETMSRRSQLLRPLDRPPLHKVQDISYELK